MLISIVGLNLPRREELSDFLQMGVKEFESFVLVQAMQIDRLVSVNRMITSYNNILSGFSLILLIQSLIPFPQLTKFPCLCRLILLECISSRAKMNLHQSQIPLGFLSQFIIISFGRRLNPTTSNIRPWVPSTPSIPLPCLSLFNRHPLLFLFLQPFCLFNKLRDSSFLSRILIMHSNEFLL